MDKRLIDDLDSQLDSFSETIDEMSIAIAKGKHKPRPEVSIDKIVSDARSFNETNKRSIWSRLFGRK